MKGEFVIRIGSAIITYKTFDEIPLEFDNLISFKPDAPEPPHTLKKTIKKWKNTMKSYKN